MTQYTNTIVGNQVPEFIRNDNPVCIEFLRAYYKFLDQYNVQYTKVRDIDATSNSLALYLRQEFANKFPTARIDDRKLVKIIRKLYQTKGTVNAIDLMFRIFFNEAVVIYQPNKSILRASDGNWEQESSIILRRAFGSVPDGVVVLTVENDSGKFFIEIDRYEPADLTHDKFYFKSFRRVPLEPNQYIDIINSAGEIVYKGQLEKSPSKIIVDRPGKDWKVGQVFFIPGNTPNTNEIGISTIASSGAVTDTVARVTAVTGQGEISSVQITEFGYPHPENQITVISPYPFKPLTATSTLDIVITDYNPATETYTYSYTLGLEDYTEGVDEEVVGVSDSFNTPESYFLERYNAKDYPTETSNYVAYNVLSKISKTSFSAPISVFDTELTIEEWLESRATFRYEFDYIVNYEGKFVGTKGQLSEPTIRLQDNYFYQLFSYVIESTTNISEYQNALSMIHPAGLKYFSDLVKISLIELGNYETERTLSVDVIFLNEIIENIFDTIAKIAIKTFEDSVSSSAEITNKIIGLLKSNDVTALEEILTRDVIKVSTDTATATEVATKEVGKIADPDSVTPSEVATKEVGKIADPDTATATEVATNEVGKIADPDSVTPSEEILNKLIELLKTDSSTPTEEIVNKIIDTIRDDSSTITEIVKKTFETTKDHAVSITEEVIGKILESTKPETITTSETITSKELLKISTDSSTITEFVEKLLERTTSDPVSVAEQLINKIIEISKTEDPVSATDNGININDIIYNAEPEPYFAEAYQFNETVVTIG